MEERHAAADDLGDVRPLDPPRVEVGLEGAHVQQPRHSVDVVDHALEQRRERAVEVRLGRLEAHGFGAELDGRDPQPVLARRVQQLEQPLRRLDDEEVAARDGHVVGEADEVAQHGRLRHRAAHGGEARGLLLLHGRHRLGARLVLHRLLVAAGLVAAGLPRAQRVVGEARTRRDIFAHLLDEGLELVDDLLEGLGGVGALGGLLLEEGVDAHIILPHGRHEARVVARAQLVAERVDLEQSAAKGRLGQEEAAGELVALGAVELIPHVGAPEPEDLRGEIVLEEADGGEHVEEGRLLHPRREQHKLRWQAGGKDVDDATRRHCEVLGVDLLA
mmetsp:Transcript_14883/g.35317  ORF Transcript_14883/g.35317 Transcript_14883/m.35317 type:complete len:332 (+) Transcript_14883:1248-2243(+)